MLRMPFGSSIINQGLKFLLKTIEEKGLLTQDMTLDHRKYIKSGISMMCFIGRWKIAELVELPDNKLIS